MKLYNTRTKKIETVTPQNPPSVTIYTCGPTVYDYAHIGHWFNYVRMDTLIRALQVNQLQTTWVMNITDVGHLVSDADDGEDKLEKGARREGKTAWQVAEFYTRDFLDGMKSLNILQPDHIVKATDHITEQIELITTLETKGFTYVIDDGVYFDTSKFPSYADFAELDLDEQQAGARVSFNQQKRNLADFALWKFSPKDQTRDMEWDSPWGKGFPGWHIECSAMSMKYLGATLDIHTGGIDHVPVHHTNEIAQSEAATGQRFANYWLHSNHVTVNGEKISKSLGNGIRLQEVTERGISLEAVRLHVLESHYRSQSKFSWESLEAAQNRLNDLLALAALRWQPQTTTQASPSFDYDVAIKTLAEHLSNDLDTPETLAYLSQVSTQLQSGLVQASDQPQFVRLLEAIDTMLGIDLSRVHDISTEQKLAISQREQARASKDWAESDRLRDVLAGEGVGVKDTPNGTIWFPLSAR